MDQAGVAFAALMIILSFGVAIVLYRTWGSLQNERFFGSVFIVSTLVLGVISIARATGRMGDGPAYQTWNISLSTLSMVMLLLIFAEEWRRRKNGAPTRLT